MRSESDEKQGSAGLVAARMSGWALVLVVLEEFSRAIAATTRYQHLKHAASARNDSAADIARQIYAEFYSGADGGARPRTQVQPSIPCTLTRRAELHSSRMPFRL
jgi:hypothetical protein